MKIGHIKSNNKRLDDFIKKSQLQTNSPPIWNGFHTIALFIIMEALLLNYSPLYFVILKIKQKFVLNDFFVIQNYCHNIARFIFMNN